MTSRRTTRSRLARAAAFAAGVLALLALAALLAKPALERWVRGAIVAQLEQATGGRAEVPDVRWTFRGGTVELKQLVVHGSEPAGAPPYLSAERVLARVNLLGLVSGTPRIQQLEITRPAVHIETYADGTTNLPQPKAPAKDNRAQRIAAVQLDRVEARDGELTLNDRRIPFDFSANDMRIQVNYVAAEQRYEGTAEFGRLQATYKDLRPFASSARVEFSLAPARLEVKSLDWTSGRSKLRATGAITDFERPRVELAYQATVDLGQWSQVAHNSAIRSGTLEAQGSGLYQAGEYQSSGKLALREALYETPTAHLATSAASATYSFDRETLKLGNLVAHTLGGTAAGGAEISQWTQIGETGGQTGSAKFKLHGLSLAQMLAAAPDLKRRLGGMNLVGDANGEMALAWHGSLRNAEARLALDIGPPAADPPQDLPVTGHIDLTYRGNRGTEVSNVDLAAQNGTRLQAQGTLGERGTLRVSFTTPDLGQFEPLLAALALGEEMPAGVRGQANFTGTISGKMSSPTIVGHLELSNFDARMAPLRSGHAERYPVHLDRFAADVRYSPALLEAHNGSLRSGTVRAKFEVQAGLQRGRLVPESRIDLQASAQPARVVDLLRLAGLEYPLAGDASFEVRLAGTRNRLRGGGPIRVADGSAWGQPFKSLGANLRLDGGEIRLEQLRVAQNGGLVQGSVAYRRDNDALRFDLSGAGFDLAKVPQLRSARLKIAGVAAFDAKGEGTLAQPIVTGKLNVRELLLNGERAGDFDLEAVTRGAEMQLTGATRGAERRIAINGNIHLGGDYPGTINVRFARVDVDPLIEAVLPAHLTGHSALSGTVELTGPLRRPRELSARGTLEQLRVSLENVELANQGPIRISYAGQVARIEELHLVGEDTDFKADGTVALSGDRTLDMRADGRMNLKLLETMNPAISAYGRTAMAVSVSGTAARPSVQGQVYIRDAGISSTDLPNGLTNLNGTLVFNQNRLVVQSLRAQTGGGTLDLGGFIAYERGIYFNLTATGNDIRIRYPEGVSVQADANLRYAGTASSSLLSGDVVVNRFDVTPQFDLANYIAISAKPPTAPSVNPALNNLKFDVHTVTAPELEVQTSTGFKVTGNADLRIRGTASRPAVLGRVDISEGEVKFNNATYQLDRGDITFTNPTMIEPVFNIDATTRVRDYDITISFHGTPDQLRNPSGSAGTTFRSDPPLPTGDIMALLAMGRTREESATLGTQDTSPFTEAASNAVLGSAISNVLSSRAQKLFGLSQIKIDPSVGGPDNNPNARLTIEQQVSGRVTLTYITNLAQSTQQVVQAEFQINRNLSIIAVRDQYGVVGFDVRYRHRKK